MSYSLFSISSLSSKIEGRLSSNAKVTRKLLLELLHVLAIFLQFTIAFDLPLLYLFHWSM